MPPAPNSSSLQKSSSPDYPLLAREVLKVSGEALASKLLPALYIVATPIGHRGDISLRALITLASVEAIACEDTRTSGALLTSYGIRKPLLAYHDHNANEAGDKLIERIRDGEAIALISDAGLPLISDPGYRLVQQAQQAGITVTVIPGASAVLTALAGSGLPTDAFFFAGFLPAKSVARRKAIIALKHMPGTLIFYESPQRIGATLVDLVAELGQTRAACVARELTKLFEESRRGTLGELAAYYEEREVKGEIVLLVGAAVEEEKATAHDIDAMLLDALADNSTRDAAALVSEATGAKKSEIYARALQLATKIKR